jgi:cob(I)alamin adenosyltransferase
MKIYTRSGDKGETGLLGGVRVSKSHLVIETCGTIDETNCHIGCAIASLNENSGDNEWKSAGNNASLSSETIGDETVDNLSKVLTRVQCLLFEVGSRVAAALASDTKINLADLNDSHVQQVEKWIDQFDDQLAPLQTFILPSGSQAGCQLHLARTVCRRAERRIVSLIEAGTERDLSIDAIWLNRISDLLFVMARYTNRAADREETPWVPGA